jgi:tetratricopeptide (TPR) repeat protein
MSHPSIQQHLDRVRQYINADQIDAAIAAGQEAVALAPAHPDTHFLLGAAYHLKDLLPQALDSYRHALALRPDHPAIYQALALLEKAGDFEGMVPLLSAFLRQAPDQVWVWSNLCLFLTKAGQTALAIQAGQMATCLDPALVPAHWNLARALLRAGHFAEGWREYEWRLRLDQFAENRFVTDIPAWDGRSYAGQTLLVICEQGAGDTFQFIRFIAQAKALGGRVVVAADPSLLRALETVAGIDQMVNRWAIQESDVRANYYAYLLSLPHLLHLQTVPQVPAYLFPLPGCCARMGRIIGAVSGALLKVGLVWAGNPHHDNDRYRSLPPQAFASLAGIPGLQFFSLQKGDAARQCQVLSPGLRITDLSDHLQDFADTAAAMSLLDLVICVDTSVAHLAGAIGKKVWVLLPEKDVDWRWLDGRQDSPWYPTMRLFRQTADRQAVIAEVAMALRLEVQARMTG